MANGTGGPHFFSDFSASHPHGTFRLPDLATGKYSLTFFGCGRNSPCLPGRLGKLVAVTDSHTTAGISVPVRLGGSVSSTIKDADGHPLAGICAVAYAGYSANQAASRPDGSYLVQGLPTGSYSMVFGPGCSNHQPSGTFSALPQVPFFSLTAKALGDAGIGGIGSPALQLPADEHDTSANVAPDGLRAGPPCRGQAGPCPRPRSSR